ncbi:inositol phosphate kinase 1 isoform X2 [Rhodnius prolixus]|uniref:inositol phosphate kinase 1 isoform X2 n=1 Tax=Rhodnius prolixus TaxID=13249 RepID=UPI003D18A9C1
METVQFAVMKVQNQEESNEEESLQTFYNLTDCLWNCDKERWDGCWRIRNFTLANTPWLYRGEGNANLVISLPREKVILRLQKLEYDVKITSSLLEELEQKLLRDVEFYRKVMVSFLGTSFFQPPILTRISEKEVSQIDQNLFTIRPRYRLTKGIRCGLVTVHPDYTHLPPTLQSLSSNIYQETLMPTQINATYCIEIKPKQGWIPLLDRKHPKCTFCMNQYLKIMKKRVVGISQYCPLDLFSGNTIRMKRAVRNLLMTPQNNLKIFKNGNLIFSEDFNRSYMEVLKDFFMIASKDEVNIENLMDRWCSLVVSGLCMRLPNITAFKNSVSDNNISEIISPNQYSPTTYNGLTSLYGQIMPCDWSSQPLPNNSILQRILKVQQLQNTNFAAVCSLYRERCATEGDYSYIESLLDCDREVDIIQRYLLATTAKDCSIFLALKSASKGDLPYKSHFIKDCEGMEYRLNIGISDIDPKPLSCIDKHIKRDKEVLDAVLQFMHHTTPA